MTRSGALKEYDPMVEDTHEEPTSAATEVPASPAATAAPLFQAAPEKKTPRRATRRTAPPEPEVSTADAPGEAKAMAFVGVAK
ncbi:MAG TPA: hypothetical protein VGP37_06780, partial [Candidatus Nanopelagicales bacterium]|nr:hypothetical protein [Candidatus Nanopelagicales bacterium]